MLGARIARPHILRGEKANCRRGTTPRGGWKGLKGNVCEREKRERGREKGERKKKKNFHHLLLSPSHFF